MHSTINWVKGRLPGIVCFFNLKTVILYINDNQINKMKPLIARMEFSFSFKLIKTLNMKTAIRLLFQL